MIVRMAGDVADTQAYCWHSIKRVAGTQVYLCEHFGALSALRHVAGT